jgi:hypothetical protein
MVRNSGSSVVGFYNRADNGWDYYWDGGVLTAGTVPYARLSGVSSMATQSRFSVSGQGVAYGGAPLGPEIQSQGSGAAAMTFHRPGAFAAHFGLDVSNRFSVGGWSYGANSYPLIMGNYNDTTTIVRLARGTNANPAYSFGADTDTGLMSPADGQWRLIANGSDVLSYAISNVYVGGGPGANLQVNGNGFKIGGGSWGVYSDSRLKKNISAYTDGLDKIRQINPVSFQYNGLARQAPDNGITYYGAIAQAMQQIAPYTVSTGDDGYLTFDASAVTFMLINGIKDLDLIVKSNTATLASLNSTTTNLTKANLTVTNTTSTLNLTVTGSSTIANLKVTGLTEVANLKVNGKIITAGDVPVAQVGTSLTSVLGASVTNDGTDTAGTVVVESGTQTSLAGEIADITFTESYSVEPKIVISGNNSKSAKLGAYVVRTADGFKIMTDDPLALNTEYSFDYIVIEAQN